MVKIYNYLIKILQLVLNLMFVAQILLMILVFLTATYWFLDLIGSTAFSFAEPLATSISNVIRLFYSNDIEVGGAYVDGTLLMFNVLALIMVFVISKLKYYVNKGIDNVYYAISDYKKKNEAKFNEKLKEESDDVIKKYNKVALLIKFEPKNIQIDAVWGSNSNKGEKEKRDEAYNLFYASLRSMKQIERCDFYQNEDMFVIKIDDFNKVDTLLIYVLQAIRKINTYMKTQKWVINYYMVADSYYNSTSFEKKVYPAMVKLINLRNKNAILAFGSFNIRYSIMPEPREFDLILKGNYEIEDGSDVYSLVKKS